MIVISLNPHQAKTELDLKSLINIYTPFMVSSPNITGSQTPMFIFTFLMYQNHIGIQTKNSLLVHISI